MTKAKGAFTDAIKFVERGITEVQLKATRKTAEEVKKALDASFMKAYKETPFKKVTGNYLRSKYSYIKKEKRATYVCFGINPHTAPYGGDIERCRPFKTKGHHILQRTLESYYDFLYNPVAQARLWNEVSKDMKEQKWKYGLQ